MASLRDKADSEDEYEEMAEAVEEMIAHFIQVDDQNKLDESSNWDSSNQICHLVTTGDKN